MSLPSVIQVEPTNACNFSCLMCLRNFWEVKSGYMNVKLFEKLAREAFKEAERITLYGEGEPLVHPEFPKFVDIARRFSGRDTSIFFVTNGSLLTPRMADKLIKRGVNEIAFSVDSTDLIKLSKIRRGIEPLDVFRNLEYVASVREKTGLKLGISTTLMRENYSDLIDLVESAANLGIDYISVSHVFTYGEPLVGEYVYSTISKESFEASYELISESEDSILKAIYEAYMECYGVKITSSVTLKLKSVWKRASSLQLDVNPISLIRLKSRLMDMNGVQDKINEARKAAKEYGVKLDIPDVFASINERKCPYVERDAVYIRWDGKVTPCMNYSYSHKTFINGHMRYDKEVVFGDLNKMTLHEVWNNEKYVKFRNKLKEINRNFPWCGDCPYSTASCWFTKSNEMDCYGNEPTCNECPYSMGLVKCLI